MRQGKVMEIRELQKRYPMGRKGHFVHAVRGISLDVRENEIFGFLGPNGAGKTTTMKMLATLLPIDSGHVRIRGYDVEREPNEVRRRIGYVSQMGGADSDATGRENLMLMGRLYGMRRADAKKSADELIELLSLGEMAARPVKTWSGGQKRRLEIALGLIHRPELLFLDEPTTGLDPQNRVNLWAHIRTLRERGSTVFLTTHYLEEADELADRLAIIDGGKIVNEGTPESLKRQISGDVIALTPKKSDTPTDAVVALAESADFVNEARADGDAVTLYVEDGPSAMPKLFDLFAANGLEIETISISRPSLNDVFIKQTGRSLRDAK